MSINALMVAICFGVLGILAGFGRREPRHVKSARVLLTRLISCFPRIGRRKEQLSPELLIAEIAARLNTGASTESAVEETLIAHGVPPPRPGVGERISFAGIADAQLRTNLEAAIKFSEAVGAPLVNVLEQIARGVQDASEEAAERRLAFAGPKASARLLAIVPIVGLLGSELLGANSFQVVTDGGIGTFAGALGVVFMLAGALWMKILVDRASS